MSKKLLSILAILMMAITSNAQTLNLTILDELENDDDHEWGYQLYDGDVSIAEGTYVQINIGTWHTEVMNIYMNDEVVYTKPSGSLYHDDVYHFTAGTNCKILGGANMFDWYGNLNVYITQDASVAVTPHTVRFASGNNGWQVQDVTAATSAAAPAVLQNVMAGDSLVATYNGTKKVKSVKAVKFVVPTTPLDNTTTAWADGSTFAVPAGGLTYGDAVTVSGNVTLTLTEGTTLTLNKGISLAEGATLTVQGNGTMYVNGTNGSTASTVAGSGTLVLTSGTLFANGGNGQSLNDCSDDYQTGASGGVAINGNVTINGGTATATGGNGGDLNVTISGGVDYSHGGNGGVAISGSVTVNAGTWTATNGSNGSYTGDTSGYYCSAGNGSAAVAGTVTDNR